MKYIKAFIAIVLLVAVDQVSKWLAFTYLRPNGSMPLIKGVFELEYLENNGSAFGFLQNQKILFIILTIVVLIVLGYLYTKIPDIKSMNYLKISGVVLIAGALGNFIDRVAHTYVIDFFYFKLIDFPIFNVADIYVVVSVITLFLLVLFYYKEEQLDFISFKKKKED